MEFLGHFGQDKLGAIRFYYIQEKTDTPAGLGIQSRATERDKLK